MLSLKEVRRAADTLSVRLAGTRLHRITQPDGFRLLMEFSGRSKAQIFLLSCRPRFARVSCVHEMPKAVPCPPAFLQYLKAHLDRAAFEGVRTSPHDRCLGIRMRGPAGDLEIVLSILGARSNIYLLDLHGILRQAMRPLAQTRRALALGQPWVDPEGGPKSEGDDRWIHVPDPEYLEAIEDTYAALERAEEAETLGRRIELVLRREAESLERKSVNLLQDLGEAVQAENYRHRGEMLKLVLHEIPPGAGSVVVKDYETGAEDVIPLDPRLTPADNLGAYFKRYQRELRSAKALREQLEQLRGTQEETTELQQRLERVLSPPDLAALQALAEEPRVRRLLARQYPERKSRPAGRARVFPGKREIPGRLLPKRYKTEQGLEIWVGRNEEGNDYLTTRLARGNDLFFHLEGYPGSHVILRTGGNAAPPEESVLAACELAVHFSKMKEARRADVHVVPVKNVRKPKGAKPGLVYVTGGRTIHLRRDPRRLENILAARLEE